MYKKSEINSLEDFQTPFINILDQISDFLNKETKEFNLSIVLPGTIDSKNKKLLTQSAIKDIDLIKYFIKTRKKITGKNFFELFNQNDKTLVEMMEDFTSHLTKLIINLIFH
ncbi:hypothetical protein [Spiroplasma endosymbiont of Cantharis nigra]|uniref:hypothetical protein n=1 Tax=Spiroplasma endosymbiont of Cantharis nigra TaxID=3066278 RepID=UPI0030D43D50